MKNKLLLVVSLVIFALATLVARAQTTNTFSFTTVSSVTNWVAVPYAKYDLQNKAFGFGGALLYKVSPNFFTGARFDRINGAQTTAGVQAQLQTTVTVAGLTATPFLETSVGLGQSALYGSTGPGLFLNLYTGHIGKANLSIGLVGDYEHVINGSENYNCLNAGPLFNLTF